MAVSPWTLDDHDKGPAPEDKGGRELTFHIPQVSQASPSTGMRAYLPGARSLCCPFTRQSQPLSPTLPLSIFGAVSDL